MFRIACLSVASLSVARAAFVMGMALAVFGAMNPPASAQGTVRGHGVPPAPKPTVDRDQRRGVPETDAVQWEVRDDAVKTCQKYMLANVRRAGNGQASMLAPGDKTGKETTWSGDGGNWSFQLLQTINGETMLRCGNLNPTIKEGLALINWKRGDWLDTNLKMESGSPWVWKVKGATTVVREGIKYQRFAIFNENESRYLMLCHDEADKKKNNQALCLYDAVIYPPR